MRRIGKAIAGLLFLASVLLTAPGAGWARGFYYTRPHYYFLPIQMQFADKVTGNPISGNANSSNMIMHGGDVREFASDVVDFNGNGRIDMGDFKVWAVVPDPVSVDIIISGDAEALFYGLIPDVSLDISPVPPNLSTDTLLVLAPQLRPLFEAAFLSALRKNYGQYHMFSSTEDLLSVTWDGFNSEYYDSATDPVSNPPTTLPRRVALLRVTARQQLGDDGSNYKEQIAQLKYTLYMGPTSLLDKDEDRSKLTSKAETSEMNILIRPSDQGGNGGDNGGGSCDALALGAALLLVPGLFLIRRGNKR